MKWFPKYIIKYKKAKCKSMVSLCCKRNRIWDKIYLSAHLCKKKNRNDKTENNEIMR